MNRAQFLDRLQDAARQLFSYTNVLCFNDLSPNYKFILSPNLSSTPVVLDDIELDHMEALKKLERKPLELDELPGVLCIGDRVPLWINMSVYEAGDSVTLIELVCSRRLRKEDELFYKVDKYPPFHILAPVPPNQRKADEEKKFDVNWRVNADRKKHNNLLYKVKSYFSM